MSHGKALSMERQTTARFRLGDVVQRRDASFRGVVIDIDPSFDDRSTEAMQPFYRILAVGPDGGFTAYTREDELVPDPNQAILHPDDANRLFTVHAEGRFTPVDHALH